MSERDGYEHGVPCWVDTWRDDPESAVGFYRELFGWEAEQTMPAGASNRYFICRLRGRDVAGIGTPLPPGAPDAAWATYVWVESVDETAAKATEAGGSVLAEPTEGLDGGRVAILADPAGAAFGVWQPGGHGGAQLVNEPSAWSMSALNTRDAEDAKAFYGALFGWTTESFDLGGAEVTMFRLPGYVGGEPGQPVSREVIATMAPIGDELPADAPPYWSADFWIADAEGAAETAVRLGGRVLAPPTELPGAPLKQGILADPEGATFSVTELRVPPA
jgi:predicted enzyme related to lactoylglutathione lyase